MISDMKQDTGPELKQDEFSKIFDEYRAKIEEITRRTENGFHSADATPENNGHNGNGHIEVIPIPSAQEEPVDEVIPEPEEPVTSTQSEPATETSQPRSAIVRPVSEEVAEILDRARHEASQIIREAEESAKKEAKKRTKSQVEKALEKAQKEAAEIVERANRDAEEVREGVINKSKSEADRMIKEITEKYRQQTEAQTSRAISEAQDEAKKMLDGVAASTRQVGERITEITAKAKQMISEMETNLQAESTELSRIVAETQTKLEEAGLIAKKETNLPESSNQAVVPNDKPTLAIRLLGETTYDRNDNSSLFKGQMEMRSISESFDYQYLKNLKKYLVHTPNIKYLQEYASEKEMSVVFDVLEPLPLLHILSNLPMVDEVITQADDDICLVFKNA